MSPGKPLSAETIKKLFLDKMNKPALVPATVIPKPVAAKTKVQKKVPAPAKVSAPKKSVNSKDLSIFLLSILFFFFL